MSEPDAIKPGESGFRVKFEEVAPPKEKTPKTVRRMAGNAAMLGLLMLGPSIKDEAPEEMDRRVDLVGELIVKMVDGARKDGLPE